ncbi:uncharacterized protein LOC111083494 [Limulus polyphemus]|uniref:Uncharacterized protein LOC111083494 n=1 Tax=Limulus polyphemus TaxID=6850 RepID=A0ABM1RWL8_LIMPO|nr:uncharacterized protein LOC111083494 [Limulus polyphemus]
MKWSSQLRELFHYGLCRSNCNLSESAVTKPLFCFPQFPQNDCFSSIGYETFVQSQFSPDQGICRGRNISFSQVLNNVAVNCDQPTNLEQGLIYHSLENQQSFPCMGDYYSHSSEVTQSSPHTSSTYTPRSHGQHPFLMHPSSTCDSQELSQIAVSYPLDGSSLSPDTFVTHSGLYTGEFANNR